MPNTFFQFKHFIIHQEKAAMKVCTDACLFGAWVANEMESGKGKIENILDIGTGTGLLSLMLAQKTKGAIDAVEIDASAYEQANENFMASPWKNRLHLHHSSIQHFNQSTDQLFNIIISNPPFFERSLKSSDKEKNIAKHTAELSYEEVSSIVSSRLTGEGEFYILLPYAEFQKFTVIAKTEHLFLKHQVNIKQSELHDYFRTMGVFLKSPTTNVNMEAITIKENNMYSTAFISLLKDYYLYL